MSERDGEITKGAKIAQVFETTVEAKPGDREASLTFIIKNDAKNNYHVLTNGWQSWSSSAKVGQTDKLVGMKPFDRSLGGRTVPFFEPGPGGERIPYTEGRSYGFVGFRNIKGGEDIVLGVIPGFDSLESIRFKQEGEQIIVNVIKNLEGVLYRRDVKFKVFMGSVNPSESQLPNKPNYADLVIAFSKELSKLGTGVPLMQDRAIGFSWPAYGPVVNQADMENEIKAAKGIIDTYIIDDGWETVSGSLTVNTGKFPRLPELAKQMKEAGVKPGIWVAPFKIKQAGAASFPKEWFMKDKNGQPKKLPLPQPMELLEGSYEFDISNPEFRKYLVGKLTDLAKMGFEVFKMDFLAVPFTGKLQNSDQTSVEYYRQIIQGIRQAIFDEVGKEVELIGCGAPIMESIGLFNGMRMTPDSALQNLGNIFNHTPLSRLVAAFNTEMYKDATAVVARRILPFREVHGLILDGIHIADQDVPLTKKRDRLNSSVLALNRLGISNLFVGDSLIRVGEKGRQAWQDFISIFKEGNAELELAGKKLPKIPDLYVKIHE